jgi:hypothetical protein
MKSVCIEPTSENIGRPLFELNILVLTIETPLMCIFPTSKWAVHSYLVCHVLLRESRLFFSYLFRIDFLKYGSNTGDRMAGLNI